MPDFVDGYILIARIVAVYGRDGFLRLNSFSDFPDRFKKLKTVSVEFYASFKQLKVEKVKYDGQDILMKFEKFDTDKDVEVLVGKDVYIPESEIVNLPANTYFIHDLIGSRVIFKGVELGTIEDVMVLPANDVYVIRKEGKEVLVPAVSEFIESFSAEEKLMLLSENFPGYDDED